VLVGDFQGAGDGVVTLVQKILSASCNMFLRRLGERHQVDSAAGGAAKALLLLALTGDGAGKRLLSYIHIRGLQCLLLQQLHQNF
jgi:hypothetical protein